jgi:hypothetical protein
MSAVWIVAAIALAGVAFMLGFLIALLREGVPSVCYWVVPVRRELQKKEQINVLRGVYVDDDCRATEWIGGGFDREFLENEGHAKEDYDSGLITLDVRHASARLGRRSI